MAVLPLGATAVGTGAVKYPVNLGPESDPSRIPLGWVPCESNHGYGTIELISEPVPLVHGGWDWDGGLELNGNLASAFGIAVVPEDTTNVPFAPVEIRLRRQTVPGYSPYTKEQVLLATLRCLLDAVSATSIQPLEVKIVTEDPADEGLKRLAGKYVTKRAGEVEFEPTPLPGCTVDVLPSGVEVVVFPEPGGEAAVADPAWVPFPLEGDIEGGHFLLPLWAGNRHKGDRLALLGQSWPVVQDRFQPADGNPDANLLTRRQLLHAASVVRDEDGATLLLTIPADHDEELRRDLAAACWAAILTERPSRAAPLRIELLFYRPLAGGAEEWLARGWTKSEDNGQVLLSRSFVWDAEKNALAEGDLPDLDLVPGVDGGWELVPENEGEPVP